MKVQDITKVLESNTKVVNYCELLTALRQSAIKEGDKDEPQTTYAKLHELAVAKRKAEQDYTEELTNVLFADSDFTTALVTCVSSAAINLGQKYSYKEFATWMNDKDNDFVYSLATLSSMLFDRLKEYKELQDGAREKRKTRETLAEKIARLKAETAALEAQAETETAE